MDFNFTKDFQMGIIELMVNDSQFAKKASHYLDKDYFKNKHLGFFFDNASQLIAEHDCISWMMLETAVMDFDIDKREEYNQILDQIKTPDLPRPDKYIREQLETFAKKAVAFKINEKLVASQNKDPDKLIKLIETEIDDLKNLTFAKKDMMTFAQAEKLMEESASKAAEVLPLGLPEIDDALDGGIPRETLTLAIGGTNVGKSVFLTNAAYNFLKCGYKVLYISLEGAKLQSMLRLLSRATQIPYGRIRTYNLNDDQLGLVDQVKKKFDGKLMMKHIGEFNYTIEDLCSLCSDIYQDFEFDALVLDYGQILGAKQKCASLRERQMYVHRGLSSIGAIHNAAVLTVGQGTRDAQEKNNRGELLRMTDISECFEICRVAATVITLNRSEHDEQSERVQILLDKQRDGKKGVLQKCKTDMTFIGFYGEELEGLGYIDEESPDDSDLPTSSSDGH